MYLNKNSGHILFGSKLLMMLFQKEGVTAWLSSSMRRFKVVYF